LAPPSPIVTAVVVTYNRAAVLAGTLQAVLTQSTRPHRVLVVDNASTDGTSTMLATDYPGVDVLTMPDNAGFGAGLAAGMRRAVAEGADFCWLLDDDSSPARDALSALLAAARSFPAAGLLGFSGGALRWGVPERSPFDDGAVGAVLGTVSVYSRDWSLVDGALVPRRTAERVGYPRSDFFMMMEDIEYTGRIRRSGAAVLVLQPDLISRAHLGSTGPARAALPWREYYQTRNHLLMARGRRSTRDLAGWAFRQAKFFLADSTAPGGRTRIRYRLVGVAHGLQGRSGRTLDPSTGRFAAEARMAGGARRSAS
jgi:GT2 family glycosyltransferase